MCIRDRTISVRYEEQKDYVGGAAIVAKHLRSAGAEDTFSTILGNDEKQTFVINDLNSMGIKVNYHSDFQRPTTYKNAIVADGYRLLKVDTVDNRQISDQILKKLSVAISEGRADAVVFSAFRHG